jgi:hypothetical protein
MDILAKWAEPKNKKELRQFLGVCAYYRKFVKDFLAEMAKVARESGGVNRFEGIER